MSSLSNTLSNSLANSLADSIAGAGIQKLLFDRGHFANDSPRNLFAKNPASGLYEMTGPFAVNTLATRVIGGKRYGLFERVHSTENTYSEVFRAAISDWIQTRINVSDDAAISPIGNLTADKLIPTTDNATHQMNQTIAVDGSSQYVACVFFKKAEAGYSKARLRFSDVGFAGSGNCYLEFDCADGTINDYDNVNFYGILQLIDDWYFVYLAATSNAATTSYIDLRLLNDSYESSFAGDGSSGLYVWGANVIKAPHLTSYIKTESSPETKSPDVLYYSNADLPNWLKGSQNQAFTRNVIPNYTTAQLAASKFLFSVDGTENVECYIDSSGYVNIDVDSVSKFQSSAPLGIGLHDVGKITVVPNNGSNCRVIVSGFTSGNFDETGTVFSMQDDGDLYDGCRHTTDDLHFDGLISEFRKGLN